jgi:chromosome segregation protein
MLLKRVFLHGFKSFADRVEFAFATGVTCIVGPNGCGKSNVVDAVKWVLGEQSARSLRGRQMLDMIFNGSASRRSSGFAQVDLVFDNTDHRLSVDQTEVTVSRKLYRSGESEYLLNNQISRLKDLRELFMDTGVGTEAYSIIEQGKVDVLLASSPTERRVIFEEAAGISKYKSRRREAERKMERTDQNLLRVADVIEEIERRLRSVKLQAGKARSFLEYEARLNELRSAYSLAEYHRFTESIRHQERECAGHGDRVTELKAAIDRHEAEEVRIGADLDRLAEHISQCDAELVRAQTAVTAEQERIAAARRREQDAAAQLERSVQRRQADARRIEETDTEHQRLQHAAAEMEERTAALRRRIDERNEQDRQLARNLTEAQALLEDEKAGIIELLRRSAAAHNEVIRLNTHRESLLGQKGRLADRDAKIAAELEALIRQRDALGGRIRECDELIDAETRRLEEKKSETARVSTLRQQLIDSLAAAKERRSALLSRQELLRDLEQRREGIGEAARMILERRDEAGGTGPFSCVLGLTADLFQTDVAHARVIEAALGDMDQCVIVDESAPFLSAVTTLGPLPGRVTVLCLDRMPPLINEPEFPARPGVVACALDLVRHDERYRLLARHLLGRTFVVETLEDARALAREDTLHHRFVTLAGEVVEPDGRMRLGTAASQAGLISRRSELTDNDQQLIHIEEDIERLADRLNRTQAEVGHLERIQQELRTAIYECTTTRVEANAGWQNTSEAIRRLSEEQPLIAREVELLEHQISDVLQRSEEGSRGLEVIEHENRRREEIVSGHQARIDSVVEERRAVQEELTELRVSAGQLTEKRAAASETISALQRQLHELHATVDTARADETQFQGQIDDARAALETGSAAIETLGARIRELDARSVELRRGREGLRINVESLGQTIRNVRVELAGVEEAYHAAQMALSEARVRRDELTTRVLAEMNVDLSDRYEHYEHMEQDWAATETEIAELRGRISRLGNVNLDAIAELEELEQRHGFLATQRDDLTESLRQLSQLIERLNNESVERFRASFDSIREHFRTLFRKLFNGGRADVILEDPENVLESGIEILAQPPGKELQSITLMSGGEKTMTAIALLLGIFKSKPAPFAILDEVDAALDEANNDRFNKIIADFLADSQFIIITHSRRTMSIADQMYGVTMQEPGVSTLVSVKLREPQVA